MYVGSTQPSTAPPMPARKSSTPPPASAASQTATTAPPTAPRNFAPSRRSGVHVYIPAVMSRAR